MPDEYRQLKGQHILVTGASSGIGAATVELLAAQGATVGIHFQKQKEAALALRDKVQQTGGRADIFEADFLHEDERQRIIPEAIERWGRLEGLVNNSGAIIGEALVSEVTPNAWRETFMLNVEAPFFLAQAALNHMQQNGGGRIVNISSVGVKFGGSPKTLHYAASKAALETVTLGMAKAGAAYQVLVNAVRPGVIQTALHANKSHKEWEARISLIPMQRAGTPMDVAHMILFLLSPASNFITGQVFTVSGGE